MAKKTKDMTVAQVVAKRRRRLFTREGYRSLLLRILLLAAVCYALFTQVFLITQVSGQDMFPAMKDGDLLVVYRLQQTYAVGDIVSYQVEGVRHFGRIAANQYDGITINKDGSLTLNGSRQDGEILYPTYTRDGEGYYLHIPEGQVFLLGDYRTQTKDSRDFGAIPMTDVEGKVISLLRRRGL